MEIEKVCAITLSPEQVKVICDLCDLVDSDLNFQCGDNLLDFITAIANHRETVDLFNDTVTLIYSD